MGRSRQICGDQGVAIATPSLSFMSVSELCSPPLFKWKPTRCVKYTEFQHQRTSTEIIFLHLLYMPASCTYSILHISLWVLY